MAATDQLRVEIGDDGVGTLTLDRPRKRNALSIELREAITATLAEWGGDHSVRVVVIAAEGPAFCAGFDLEQFARPELAQRIKESSTAYHRAVWEFGKPTIAAVGGPAMGGGFDLATLCDLRIASTDAVFGHPEIKLGAPPLFTPLRWLVGDGVARELLLTGRRVDAAEALRIGLVSRVAEPGELDEAARGLALEVAEAPQAALEATKAYLVGDAAADFDASFKVEHDDVFDRFLGQGMERDSG